MDAIHVPLPVGKDKVHKLRRAGIHVETIEERHGVAFAALKAWNPEAAAPYGDGKLWGFA